MNAYLYQKAMYQKKMVGIVPFDIFAV